MNGGRSVGRSGRVVTCESGTTRAEYLTRVCVCVTTSHEPRLYLLDHNLSRFG